MVYTTNSIPSVVELAGPAGAGKTTLLRALNQRYPKMQIDLPVSKVRGLPFYIRNLSSIGPAYLWPHRGGRWFDRGEQRSMIYLKAWHDILVNHMPKDAQAILLDHGPIYRLATLREFGPPITQSARFKEWWNRSFEDWATTLDVVICLDAPDSVLMERIQEREQEHIMQGEPRADVYAYLGRYRQAITCITEKLCSGYGVSVVNINSATTSVNTTVARIQAVLHVDLKDKPQVRGGADAAAASSSVKLWEAKA